MENERLRDWYYYGLSDKATHLLIVADVVDFTERPIYVYPKEWVLDKIKFLGDTPYLIVLDIYSYAREFEVQLLDKKRNHYT